MFLTHWTAEETNNIVYVWAGKHDSAKKNSKKQ